MFGSPRAIGIGPPVHLGGRRLLIRARTLRDYAAIEARILELRGNPFNALRWLAAHGWSRKFIHDRLMALRFDNWWYADLMECLKWLQTWEGRIYGLWLATDTDFDFIRNAVIAECNQAIRKYGRFGPDVWWSEIQTAIDIANGDDEVGSLDWLARPSLEKEKPTRTSFWARVFCLLSEDPFCFPPRQIEQMTLSQLNMITSPKPNIAVFQDALHYERLRREAIEKAVDNIMHHKHWSG